MPDVVNPFSYKWTMYPGMTPLSFGEMDYDPDPAVIAAVTERLRLPLTYPPPYESSGVASAIAAYYKSSHNIALSDEAFWIASSCLAQSYHIFSSLVSRDDEVLYWKPAFYHIPGAIEAAGATAVPVETAPEQELVRADLESLIGPATRAIYLVNPQNPTGKIFTAKELRIICETAADHGLAVVSNELHGRLVLEGEHIPFATISETAAQLSITLSGASKSHNLAGISGSFAFSANEELLRSVKEPARHRCPDATSVQQAALVAAYAEDSPWLYATRAQLKAARDLVCGTLGRELPELTFSVPRATYFLWVDFEPYLERGETAANALRTRCGIVVGCGTAFGARGSLARLSFSLREEVLRQALDQIVTGLLP